MTSQTNFFKEWRPERDRSISDQPFENQHQRTSKESVKKHLEDPWTNIESIMTPQNRKSKEDEDHDTESNEGEEDRDHRSRKLRKQE